ncbi:MAG: hypothetical protein HQL94_07405, partial [Magnetococcales bacterium]|nr:hypothetical protein [Magnetococcales bacterium]
MKEVLLIASGTLGAKQVGQQFQPYVRIRDKFCVEHVLDAAIQATSIGTIYIWGDKARLESMLAGTISRAVQLGIEVRIVQEKSNFVDSFLFTYMTFLCHRFGCPDEGVLMASEMGQPHWELLQAFGQNQTIAQMSINLLLSDTPLIRPDEIDCLIQNKNPQADFVLGRTVKQAMDVAMSCVPEPFQYSRAIKNYYNFVFKGNSFDLIVNSFMAGRPLLVPRYVWNLAGHLFNNRTIIEGGRFNLKKIKSNAVFFKTLFSQVHLHEAEQTHLFPGSAAKKYYQRLKAFSFLVRAYFIIVKNKSSNNKFRDL